MNTILWTILYVFLGLFALYAVVCIAAAVWGVWCGITGKSPPPPTLKEKAQKTAKPVSPPVAAASDESANAITIDITEPRGESWLSTGLKLYGAYHLLGFGKNSKSVWYDDD